MYMGSFAPFVAPWVKVKEEIWIREKHLVFATDL
jgi:hypothetical protein